MFLRVGWYGAAAAAASLLLPAPIAAQTAPGVPSTAPSDPLGLDPDAPLAPMPDIGVDWPALDPELNVASPEAIAAEITTETRYAFRIEGLDGVGTDLLRQRFAEASTLDANDGEPANAAQLDRRAREDAELLTTLLRAEGYYDARVLTRVEPGNRPTVVLAAEPGGLYRFDSVTLEGIEAAGARAGELRGVFGVAPGSAVNADQVAAAELALRQRLEREGFPFAEVGQPEIVVDRAQRTATLDLPVRPGDRAQFGRITALAGNRVFDPEHVQTIARFRPGEPFDQAELDDLRRALIQTGLVSSVELRPAPGTTPGTVDLGVRLEPAPPRTVAGELGYGTGEGARAELSWTHRNFLPPEGALTLRGVLGTQEQVGAVVFRRNNFRGRDRVLTAQIAVAHLERDAFEADTLSLATQLERQTNIFFQKTWTWSLGAELLASDERDVVAATGDERRRTFFIAALPTSLNYDGSDDLLNPTRGFRLGGRISPELSLQG